jgi:hypothetical protein
LSIKIRPEIFSTGRVPNEQRYKNVFETIEGDSVVSENMRLSAKCTQGNGGPGSTGRPRPPRMPMVSTK